MTKSSVAEIAIVLLISGITFAQVQAGPATPAHSAAATAKTATAKTLTVSGRVSEDGKTLLTDLDSEWAVSNADALKGHEGHLVTVKCYVDSERNRIQILSVKKVSSQSEYAAHSLDSAFRR
jgi:hypothetical protein